MNKNKTNLDFFFENTTKNLNKKIKTMISDRNITSILKNGKRLRPLLVLLSFKTCTQGKESDDEYQRALEGAVSIELAYSASLVHDDIIDNDLERRGEPSFHVAEGVDTAILTGHRMLALGFKMALKHGEEIAKLYVDTWNEILSGEFEQVNFNKKNFDKNSKDFLTKNDFFRQYNKIIELKNAVLFSSACKAGAIEANMSGDILRVFADYGREIGLAYQLADDLVDLAKGEMIDSVIIPLLNKLENKKIITDSLKSEEIKNLFAKHEAEIKDLFLDEIKKHVRKAEETSKSESIPQTPYKNLLFEAPRYIVNKMLKEIKITI